MHSLSIFRRGVTNELLGQYKVKKSDKDFYDVKKLGNFIKI